MELRSVEELMDLLHACRGAWDTPDLPRSRLHPSGGRPVGDPVDLHDHALQTAALLRRGRPSDKELQVAGLVHDIGHLLRPGDDAGHADHAADAIRPLLGERVSRLVRLHVAAKRYLATASPRGLPPRSTSTPAAQGGAMTPREATAFEHDPLAEDAVTLRQADDAGKVVGLYAGDMEDWRTVLELVAERSARLGAVD
ncbi:HD domain-containing protein [Streptomyces rhizosphaerihabitans]|uniref:HD domain-containing protein n=1 Tax=Streptomyces rhizosphaerihabitans TaxID=1266770 RepID=UPI0021BEDCF6|nr:HD domain-containing protein [Streptomyces rhizosphaerihabitans]MCT9008267.1 HD domain-containing protein [Streptomyces rhizosphaerihabitans]